MVVTDDDEVAKRVGLLRSHGMTSLTWDRHKGHASGYDVVDLGFNYRIDEPRAAFATVRLARLDADNDRRRAAAELYATRLGSLEGVEVTMPVAGAEKSAHHLFTVVLDAGRDRDGVRERMSAAGVQTSLHYPPVHRFSAYEVDAELPLTDAYAQRAISLPLYPSLTEQGIELVVSSLAEAL
jgi:dTDP-4-amino-4,6-dideoxygalactose transaminase